MTVDVTFTILCVCVFVVRWQMPLRDECVGLFQWTRATVLWQQVAVAAIKAPGPAPDILIRN